MRGQAPKKKYTDNFDSCRDLSGRRLRQVNNEKKLEQWRKRKEEEEKYVEQECKEYEHKKKELQDAIYANKYKIDTKYKQQVFKYTFINSLLVTEDCEFDCGWSLERNHARETEEEACENRHTPRRVRK